MAEPQINTSKTMESVHDSESLAIEPSAAITAMLPPPTTAQIISDNSVEMDIDLIPGPSSSKPSDSSTSGTAQIDDDITDDTPEVLSDFLHQLEDYAPTIPDAVTAYFCQTAGFEPSDPRIIRLISIAAQKFVSDVANDALQHCKTRTNNAPSSHGSSKNPKSQNNNKDRKYTLTMEDLAPALGDYGITVRKAHYFV